MEIASCYASFVESNFRNNNNNDNNNNSKNNNNNNNNDNNNNNNNNNKAKLILTHNLAHQRYYSFVSLGVELQLTSNPRYQKKSFAKVTH